MARKNVIQFSVEVIDKASSKLAAINQKFGQFAKKIAISGAALGAGLIAAGTAAIRSADKIGKLAKTANISAEALQELRFAANLAGIEARGLDDSMRRFNRRLGELANSGLGPAEKAFTALDVSIRTASGHLRGTEDVFNDVVDAMSQLQSTTQQSALAAQLFGDDFGPKLVTLLSQGSAGIDKARQKARDLGIVMSNETVAAAEDANDQFTILTELLRGKMVKAFADNAEFIADLAIRLTDAAIGAFKLLDAFGQWLGLVEKGIPGLQTELADLLGQQQTLIAQFGENAKSMPVFVRIEEDIARVIAKIKEAQAVVDEGLDRKPPAESGGIFGVVGKPSETNPLEAWVASFDTNQMVASKEFAKLRQAIADGLIPNDEDRKRIVTAINQIYERVELETIEFQKDTKDTFDAIAAIAESAAQSIQQSFADFFFDPFDKGLKGMLQSFLNVMRRMIAELFAFQTLKFFGFSDFFEKITGRSAGGPTSGTTLVGERGPELINLPRGSRVVNNTATQSLLRGTGGSTFISNIDARGADPGLIARLPQIFEERDRRLLAAVERYSRTGTMPI